MKTIRFTSLLLVCLILVLGTVFMIYLQNLSPYEYLKICGSDSAEFKPCELLCQEYDEDSDVYIVFYQNQIGVYVCSVMNRSFGFYKIVGYSGVLAVDDNNTYMYSCFAERKPNNDIELCWGIVTDQAISQVFLDNEPCLITNTNTSSLRFFWKIGEWGNDPPQQYSAK